MPLVRVLLRFRGGAFESPGIVAVARVGPADEGHHQAAQPGEIAIIDHADLDRISAEELTRRKAAAVVNASVSITGRYPTSARSLLLEAGIPVIDAVGPDVLVWVDDGMVVRLDDQTLYLGDMAVAKGTSLMPDLVQAAMAEALAMVGVQIESFAANTLEFLREGMPLSRRRPARR